MIVKVFRGETNADRLNAIASGNVEWLRGIAFESMVADTALVALKICLRLRG
jgi:hypothetical protein